MDEVYTVSILFTQWDCKVQKVPVSVSFILFFNVIHDLLDQTVL